jgi:predicted nucleotidyltransferase
MTVEQVRAVLAEHSAELEALGVARLAVFGSVARGEARPDSDVDFLVDLSRSMGLFGFAEIQLRLEDLLSCQVDLGTFDTLRERVRPGVERERVDVWPAVA